MEDDNTQVDGATGGDDNSLLGGEPPADDNTEVPEGETIPEGEGDEVVVEYQKDDEGNDLVDADGNKVPVESTEEYTDFQVPEGVEVDTEFLGVATPILKELGLNQDQAQKVVDLYSAKVAEQSQAMAKQITEWQNEARNNSEYGGDAFNANIVLANNGLKEFFPENAIQVFKDTGLGNHPAIIQGFVKIGKLMAEDSPSLGSVGSKEMSREERMYGSHDAN